MPIVFGLIQHMGTTSFTAWRIAFFIPAIFQTLSAYAIFFLGQDFPNEKFSQQLTVYNIIAQYFYDRYNVNLHTEEIIAANFGLANLFSRPGGGNLSDIVSKKFGMRGRLWTPWIVQDLGGVSCILLGQVGSLGVSVALMLIFYGFVQAGCGLTFGVFLVSRRYVFYKSLFITQSTFDLYNSLNLESHNTLTIYLKVVHFMQSLITVIRLGSVNRGCKQAEYLLNPSPSTILKGCSSRIINSTNLCLHSS
ncbi:hypothetical protein ACJIZ3_023694 [Penstemon smallii]|uniref:Uncharacterized protein n=1 Tax=Penstemon smallii TaxID=265156 RepID=A0ABD3TSR7_9LAMI